MHLSTLCGLPRDTEQGHMFSSLNIVKRKCSRKSVLIGERKEEIPALNMNYYYT